MTAQTVLGKKRPTTLDLFAGAGGLSLGLEAAGFDIAGAIDIDPIHCATHEFNFPYSATMCADITSLKTDDIVRHLQQRGFNKVDLVAGGPPCQGFSTIGYRQLDDPRNRLVFEFVRVVRDLQPSYFLFENVPGIVAGKHISFVNEVIREFRRAGYDITHNPHVINAASFGVAQSRRRFILLGHRKDVSPLSYPLDTHHEHANAEDLIPGKPFLGVGAAIGDLEKVPVFLGDDPGIDPETIHYTDTTKLFDVARSEAFSLCYKRAVKRVFNHTGARHSDETVKKFGRALPGHTEPTSRLYKTHFDKPCHTLRAGTDSKRGAYTAPRPIHYLLPRCISVREGARIHSYPDWFRFHRTIWHGFRQIGNSVAPLLAQKLGAVIVSSLGAKVSRPDKIVTGDEDCTALTMSGACDRFGVPRTVIGTRDRKEA